MDVRKFLKRWWGIGLLVGLTSIMAIFIAGCPSTSPTSPAGPTGAQPTSASPSTGGVTGTLSGKVTNSLTKGPVSGAKIVTDPAIPNQNITTDNNGAYTAPLPVGSYKLNVTKDGYTAGTDSVSIVSGQTAAKDIALKPTSPVVVSAGAAQTADPGASVTLKATATPLDGSTVQSYAWTQTSGAPITLTNANSDTLNVTLPKIADFKAAMIKNLKMPDRTAVAGINPESLIDAQTETFTVTVTTSSGKYKGTTTVTAKLPYDFTTGLANVAQGVPVLLNGKKQSAYSWTITGPAGSKATLDEPTGKNPVFTPDTVGKYTVTETTSKASLDVYAGTWSGAITGQDANGRPLAAGCTTCHDGKTAPNQFTPWAKSGHAVILTKNIDDPAGHWSLSCVGCHSVGYNTTANNGGFDEAMAAEGWKPPAPAGQPGSWTNMLAKFPKSAKLANIQCENCHGPNNANGLHPDGVVDVARVSLSADVCGSCHGEPPRHGLFQQWEESGHSNFDLAIAEATNTNCARCHTGQGFLAWTEQGKDNLTKPIQGKNGTATADELKAIVNPNNAQPQTCTVCHDPHSQGDGTVNATVRISGDTALLPSGFKATKVGKGAICMTCHNTRNGLHNDANPPTAYQAPHTPSQTDLLMGQNAYFVGSHRSAHGDVKDTCVTCHMEVTDPPAELSFNLGGANHAFAANIDICAKCHAESLNGEALQAGVETKMDDLANALTKALMNKLPASMTILDYTPHKYNNVDYDVASDPVVISKDNIASISLGEIHGQQGYTFKLKNAVSVTYKPANATHTVSVTQVGFQLGSLTTDGKTPVIPLTDNIVKAGWNYFLVHGDGSKGVHNPSYVHSILDASINALK